jgi:hypothetical protein
MIKRKAAFYLSIFQLPEHVTVRFAQNGSIRRTFKYVRAAVLLVRQHQPEDFIFVAVQRESIFYQQRLKLGGIAHLLQDNL